MNCRRRAPSARFAATGARTGPGGVFSALPLELLRGGIAVRLRVTGKSMIPFLADDDLVTLEPVDASGIRLGDLVFAQRPGLPPLLHRVIEIHRGDDGGWNVQTKGDALATRDAAMPAACVAGRVVAIQRAHPSGRCREVRLMSRRRRILQWCLALGSRHAPRAFSTFSRRLVPGLERISRRVRP